MLMNRSALLSRSQAIGVTHHVHRRAVIWCVILLAALVIAAHDTVAVLTSTWWNTTTYNHGFLILPISVYLIWLRRYEVATLVPEQEAFGLVPLAAGAALWLVSKAAEVATFQEIALVGMTLATVLFCFGWAVTRRLAFPLLFLFFMVPIGDFLIPQLQAFTGDFAVRLLRLVAVPVYHDGNLIQIPSGTFLVAEACAGLRFLIANVVIATLFSYLAYAKWWKRGLFMAIALVVPVLANGIRAFGIIYLAYLTDNRVAAGADHIIYGWGFFSLVMLILLAIGSTFADRMAMRSTRYHSLGPAGPLSPRLRPWRHAVALVAAIIVLAGPAYAWAMLRPPSIAPTARSSLPPVNLAWIRELSPTLKWQPLFPGADWILHDVYRQGADAVDMFVVYYDYQRRGAEVVYYANSMADEKTWWRYDAGTVAVHQGPSLVPARVDDVASSAHHRIVVWWYWVNGEITHSAFRAKLLQLAARLLGGNQAAAAVGVSVNYDRDPAEAVAIADRFLTGSTPFSEYLKAISQR
jgi:exosortase A